MKHRKTIVTVSLLGLALTAVILGGSGLLAGPPAAPRAAATSVGVCDVVEVFANYQRAKDLEEQMNERKKAFDAESNKRVKSIEALQIQLEGLATGSEEHNRLLQQIQRQTVERAVWSRMQEQSLMRDHLRLMKEVFAEVRKAVGEVAKDKGVDVVLQLEPNELTARTAAELVAQVDRRKVLYSADSINLTREVLRKLDEAYRAAK